MRSSAQPAMEIPDVSRWTPAGQERALDELNRANLETWTPFYCPRPSCDGNHHITLHDGGEHKCPDGRVHDWVRIADTASHWRCSRTECAVEGTDVGDGWVFRHGRADQHPPSGVDWLVWLLLAGRGAGKTRAGSEWVHRLAARFPDIRMALVSPTASDIRDTMIEGESGILATARPGMVPEYEPSKKLLTWPNGARAWGFSGEEPDRLRGKQHHVAWLDEPAHMPLIEDVWSNLMLGLRLGRKDGIDPKVCLTTSPLPIKWLKEIIAEEDTVISKASTYANLANLPEHYRKKVLARWEGTRLGAQEIEGLLVEDIEGALWSTNMLEDTRILGISPFTLAARLDRIVVGLDPAGTANARSDMTGIVVAGAEDDEIYALADYSGRYSPDGWAGKALYALDTWDADALVVEITYGRDMVINVLEKHCKAVGRPVPRVITVDSRKGKAIRAEPIVALFERGKSHIVSRLPELETELTTWKQGEKSPNRLDAMVHAETDLARVSQPGAISSPYDLLRGTDLSVRPGWGLASLGRATA